MFGELAAWCYSTAAFIAKSSFLNAPFVSAFLGAIPAACLGALAGAYTAWRIADRSKIKAELIEEIKNTNKAIQIAAHICNSVLNLKNQHVRPLKNEFDRIRLSLIERRQQNNSGIFEFMADFQTLTPISFPAQTLASIVHDKISVAGRPFSLVSTLLSSTEQLTYTIMSRNNIIIEFKSKADKSNEALARFYLGLPGSDRHVDNTYPDLVEALYSITDDCIFFSKLLSEDLTLHGNRTRKRFITQFRGEAPRVIEVSYEKMEDRGLFPPESNYSTWMTGFVEKALPLTKWQRAHRFLLAIKSNVCSRIPRFRA